MVFLANQSLKSLKRFLAFRHENHQSRGPPSGIFFHLTRTSTIRWQVTPVSVSPSKMHQNPDLKIANRRLEIPHLGLPHCLIFLVRNVNEVPNKRMPKIMKKTVLQNLENLQNRYPFLLETYPCEIITSQKHVAF